LHITFGVAVALMLMALIISRAQFNCTSEPAREEAGTANISND
jgi:hypothetical protein